jgi:hypothetical protein
LQRLRRLIVREHIEEKDLLFHIDTSNGIFLEKDRPGGRSLLSYILSILSSKALSSWS